jgi:beta-lactam-binding protein with PASTA domain
MPHLISRSYAEVRAGLEQQGFRFGRVTFERYEGIAAGTVLRQYPLAGHPLRRSEAISLAVVADPDGLLAGP